METVDSPPDEQAPPAKEDADGARESEDDESTSDTDDQQKENLSAPAKEEMCEDSRMNVFFARLRWILQSLFLGFVAIFTEGLQRCRRWFRRIDEQSDKVQLRARMHGAIEQRTLSHTSKVHCLNEVRECINSAPDLKAWLSPGEPYVSAMRKAVEKDAFDVCGLLRSHNCQFKDKEEKSCLVDMDPLRHRELRRQTTIYSEWRKSPLNRLTDMSIIDSSQLGPSKFKTKVRCMYKKLYDIELVRPILRAAATAPGLEIHFDFDSDNLSCITAQGKNYSGLMIGDQHQILIGAKTEENQVLGTLAHELCHFVLMLVYKNGSLPYWGNDTQTANSYARIFDDIKNRENPSMPDELTYGYTYQGRDAQLKELVVRVPHVLATYGSPGEGDSILQQEAKKLLDFFATDVIPKVNAYVDASYPLKEVQNIGDKNLKLGKTLEVEKHDIAFEKVIPDLGDAPLQVLSGPSLILLEIMVNDSLKWTFKPYLFLKFSQWNRKVIDAVKRNRCDVVVLTVDKRSRLKARLDILIEIVEVTGLKVILLAEEADVQVILQETKRVEISGQSQPDNICRQVYYARLDNVTAECKVRIYQSSKVRLQGSEDLALSQVLDLKTFLEVVDETTFLSLSRKEVICMGALLDELEGGDARCYIARKCKRALYVVLQRIQVGRKQEIFVLCGCPSKSIVQPEHARATHFIEELKQLDHTKLAQQPQFILLNNAGEYEALPEWVCKGKTAHLLMYDDARKCFVWQKSNGPMSHILISDNAECYDASDLLTTNDKTVVVCGQAGIGKSLMSEWLGKEIRKHDKTEWVIRLDLSKMNRELRSLIAEDVAKDPTKLAKFCGVKEDSHEMLFFKQSVTTGSPFKVVTIFDSFEEIGEKSRKNAIHLVRLLAAREVRVFIFSRSAFKDYLQDELGTVSYEISPFSKEDIEEFLEKYKEITASPVGEKRLDMYGYVSRRSESVLENPLILRMMTEVEEGKIPDTYRDFLEDILDKKKSSVSLKVFQLFVDYKYILYKKEKQGSDITREAFQCDYENAKKQFYNEHGLLALKLTLGDDACKKILNDTELAELEPDGRLIKTASENIHHQGFLSCVCDGLPVFVHRSFADFFAADFIFKKVMSAWRNDAPVINVVVGLYGKADYDEVLKFFDEFGAWSHTPHCTILNGDKLEGEHEKSRDELQRTPVHIAALHGGDDLLRNLLRNPVNEAVWVKDKLGMTPVMYADKTRAFRKLDIFARHCNDDCTNWAVELQVTLENIVKEKDLMNSPLNSLIRNGHSSLMNLILKITRDEENTQLTCYRTGGVPFENDKPENSRTQLYLLNIDSIRSFIGLTPLYVSCMHGQLETAKLLVPYSSVNIFDRLGRSPFIQSITYGNIEIMKLLLPFAFLDDALYPELRAPLMICAETNRADIINVFLQHHSWLNTTSSVSHIIASPSVHTPEASVGILGEILPHADPNGDLSAEWTLWCICGECARWDAVELLLPYSNRNSKHVDTRPLLCAAGKEVKGDLSTMTRRNTKHIKVLKILLLFLHVDVADSEGATALHLNVAAGNIRTVKIFLPHSAIHRCDSRGRSLLHYAVRKNSGDVEVVNFLLPYLSANGRDHDGISPFTQSIICGNIETMKLLLPFASLDEERYPEMDTLLITCAERNRADIINVFLQHYSWVNTTSSTVDVSATLSVRTPEGSVGIWWEIVPHAGPNQDFFAGLTLSHFCGKSARWDAVKLLLPYSNRNSKHVDTKPLLRADRKELKGALSMTTRRDIEHIKVLKILLLFSHVHAADSEGTRALRQNVAAGNIRTVKIFLPHFSINSCDDDGSNLLHYAVQEDSGDMEVVNYLLRYLYANTLNHDGYSPFMWSILYGNIKAMKLLLPLASIHESPRAVFVIQGGFRAVDYWWLQPGWHTSGFNISPCDIIPEEPFGILGDILPHADPNHNFDTNRTALHICAERADWETVKLILPYSDTNRTFGSETPYQLCTQTLIKERMKRSCGHIKAERVLHLHDDVTTRVIIVKRKQQ